MDTQYVNYTFDVAVIVAKYSQKQLCEECGGLACNTRGDTIQNIAERIGHESCSYMDAQTFTICPQPIQ